MSSTGVIGETRSEQNTAAAAVHQLGTATPSPTVLAIERVNADTLPYETFRKKYIIGNRPVIIENAGAQWKAVGQWTPEYFRREHGAKIVNVSSTVKMPMAQLIDAVEVSSREKPGPYLHKVIIHPDMPELLPDLAPGHTYGFPLRYSSPLMPALWKRPDGYLKLLIGGVGAKFPVMHYDNDNANALITEIYGEKEFVLFAPEDTARIYPHKDSPNTSQIADLENPDLVSFPLFREATQYRGVIGPGEAVFVPSGWWHSTRMLSTSISVCINMLDQSNWTGFVSESCQPRTNRSWPRRTVKKAYLHALGFALSVAERLQHAFPRWSLTRKLARFAPLPNSTNPG